MGGCRHWWQVTNNQRETNLRLLQRPKWVLARVAGESLRQVRNPQSALFLRHTCVLWACFLSWIWIIWLHIHSWQSVRLLRRHDFRDSCRGHDGLHGRSSHVHPAVGPPGQPVGADVQSGPDLISDGLRYTSRGKYTQRTSTGRFLMIIFFRIVNKTWHQSCW